MKGSTSAACQTSSRTMRTGWPESSPRSAAAAASRWGVRPEGTNPCRFVDKYPERRRERFLSGTELGRLGELLAQAEQSGSEPPAVIAAIRLLVLTGCRKSEILTLRWDSVDLERGALHLADSKTGPKSVPLGAAAAEGPRRHPKGGRQPVRLSWRAPGLALGQRGALLAAHPQGCRDARAEAARSAPFVRQHRCRGWPGTPGDRS